jgi:hypothetical protein
MSLIKVKNVTNRQLSLNGIVVLPNEEKLVPEGGVVGYCLAKGKLQVIKDNVRIHERSYLESLSMSELRDIGYKFGAKDTKKSELIEEILNKEVKLYG